MNLNTTWTSFWGTDQLRDSWRGCISTGLIFGAIIVGISIVIAAASINEAKSRCFVSDNDNEAKPLADWHTHDEAGC